MGLKATQRGRSLDFKGKKKALAYGHMFHCLMKLKGNCSIVEVPNQ